jgi:hypothetical protein
LRDTLSRLAAKVIGDVQDVGGGIGGEAAGPAADGAVGGQGGGVGPTPGRMFYPLLIERPWKKYASTLRART